MDEIEQTMNQQHVMKLSTALKQWAICLGILIVLMLLTKLSEGFVALAFLFYIGSGIYLNRAVLRRIVEWHPMHNTLYNVTQEKLKFLLLWPVMYIPLFVRLGIDKML